MSPSATRAWASCSRSAPTSCRASSHLGDRPHLEKLVGPVKVLLDKYVDGDRRRGARLLDVFVNTMKQEPRQLRMAADPRVVPAPDRRGAHRGRAGGHLGLHLRARREDAARRRAAALRRGAGLPDAEREHGVRAVRADGRDEGGVRQRRQRHRRAAAHLQQVAPGGDHQGTLRRSSAGRRRSERTDHVVRQTDPRLPVRSGTTWSTHLQTRA